MLTEEKRKKNTDYNREWRRKNPERVNAATKRYREANKEKVYEATKKWRALNKTKFLEYGKKWREGTGKDYRKRVRLEVIKHYGGKCVCCGETQFEFLAIDHKNNDGGEHRRLTGNRNMTEWARHNNYPDYFQIMCHNCNLAKGFYGVCPHETRGALL